MEGNLNLMQLKYLNTTLTEQHGIGILDDGGASATLKLLRMDFLEFLLDAKINSDVFIPRWVSHEVKLRPTYWT